MKGSQNYSMKITNFMTAFRKYLYSQNYTSVQQYFERQKLGNPGKISRLQFQKIIQKIQALHNFNVFDILQIFKQLEEGYDFIQIKKFVHVYERITSQIPFSPPLKNNLAEQQQKKRQEQEKERKNELIRKALKSLQAYMDQNDPLGLFQQCDEDSSGKLNPNEFNNLLICTEIKYFQDKFIRRTIIAQIFSYFPSKQISKTDFIKLFKIPKEKNYTKNKLDLFVPPQKVIPFYSPEHPKKEQLQPPKKEQPQHPKKEQVENQSFKNMHDDKKLILPQPTIKINIKPAQNKNYKLDGQNDGFKKKNIFQEQNHQSQKKISHQNQNVKQQLIDATQIFPQASVYYRNGQPDVEQLQYFEELQNLLLRKKVYKDLSNPLTVKGKYYQANNFFKGQSYQLFQMAQSVLQRQKSRIGLAREIEPKDIIQGEIGDCYFLSGIASLISVYPEIISEKFLFSQNPANYFVLKIFLNGKWNFITTDDFFPSSTGKDPLFAKPHGRQIWVMLIEKCWAKCFGNFESIVSGSPKQAFIALTGAPTEYLSLKSKQTTIQVIQQKIKEAYGSRFVVTASGSELLDSLSEREQEKIGLIGNHAYSFLKFIDSNNMSLVKIRNPWGSRVWKGDWSFQSNKWTKQLRNKLNYNKQPDDGSFYMCMKDFLKYFGSFVICKVNPIYTHSSLHMNFRKHKSNYVRMKILESGKYIISLYQENDRSMKAKNFTNYQYSPARIILMKGGSNWEYIDSLQNTQSYFTSLEVNLEEGCEYILSLKFKWMFWQSHEACLTSYGPEKVIFEPIGNQIAPVFKKEMIKSFFKKNRGKVKDYNKTGALGSYSQILFSLEKGIGYYFITNPSQKKWSLSYSLQGEGVKSIKPDKLPFNFELNKGSRFLKGFFISPEGYSYQSSESMTY